MKFNPLTIFPEHAVLPAPLAHPNADNVTTLDMSGYYQLREFSCGYTSALMIARYFKCRKSNEKIFEIIGTDEDGTPHYRLVNGLRRLGFRVSQKESLQFELVRNSIDHGFPIITGSPKENHYIVIYGYGVNPRRVFVADPDPISVISEIRKSLWKKITWYDFRKRKYGADGSNIVISKNIRKR